MIAVLSYDHPHRKTEDVLWRLRLAGYQDVTLVLTPWEDRPARRYLYAHRPGEPGWPCEPLSTPDECAMALGFRCVRSTPEELTNTLREAGAGVVVVGGAGILPPQVVNPFKVLNVHPGLLPMARGLDTLKWSVIDLAEVGVTSHLCDERADLGWKLMERKVPVFREDTFHAFAMRQYETELSLLSPSIEIALRSEKSDLQTVEANRMLVSEPRRRMPRRVEAGLMEAFERYKLLYASE